MSSARSGLILGIVSLCALALGLLLFFEVVRPFRNPEIDMPLAVGAGVLGSILSTNALVFRRGATLLNAIAVVLNLAGLVAVALIFQALSHMRVM